MKLAAQSVQFHDFSPRQSDFLEAVKLGLSGQPKCIAPKFFYDQRGSELFDAICDTSEYYQTRTEIGILKHNARHIAELIGPDCLLIELGSGASKKVRLLFEVLEPASYLGVDISKDFLLLSMERLACDYPWLDVHAVCADFSHRLELPDNCHSGQTVAFFPGSSIGNFEPDEAERFLHQVSAAIGVNGKLLIGVDLKKDKHILERAYNDAAGITAQFNLNLLTRMQNELGALVDTSMFMHRSIYNEEYGRIEMYIVSLGSQCIEIDDVQYEFDRAETIHTENSYKYSLEEFADISNRAGFTVEQAWTDCDALFSVQLLTKN